MALGRKYLPPLLNRGKEQSGRFLTVFWSRFEQDMISLRATGLTFTTLLSLVPFLALAFSVMKAFGVQNQLEPFLAQALKPLGPGGLEITNRVIAFVNSLRVGVLGALGVAFLFYTVISLIGKIEDSLNAIWRVRRARGLDRMFSDYLSVVLVGPILVFTAFALTASAQSYWLVQRMLEIKPLGALVATSTQVIIPFVFLCAAFTFLYRCIPNTQVNLKSAGFGGVVAGILWQLAGVLFTVFVAHMARNDAIYSSFAIMAIFLFWLYVGWVVVLIGAEVAYFHQHPHAYHREGLKENRGHRFRERLALSALVQITRRYMSTEAPWWPSDLAEILGVPFASLDDLIDEFVGAGILLRTAEPEGVSLARSPEAVPLTEVFEVLRGPELENPITDGTATVTEALGRRDQATREALEGLNLKSLSAESPASLAQVKRAVAYAHAK
ncbi:MAG TPA: YihY/virulence factor BrkB family protein [Candidatus Binatia bacterium]